MGNNLGMLILASGSPRRRELLTQAGYRFEVRAAEIDESLRVGERPVEYVTRLAREKAEVVYALATSPVGGVGGGLLQGPAAEVVVLGADTSVVVDGRILGKPQDADDAARMLRMLSGRGHEVITGVAVVSEGRAEVVSEVTVVEFLPVSEAEIAAYVASGEPMDKAGAYGIQGRAARWIPRIEGCYFNVVGLPVARVGAMLEGVGVRTMDWERTAG